MGSHKAYLYLAFNLVALATTYAQQTSAPNQGNDVRTCGEKTNLCYYLLNDINPVTSNKTEKCARVFSVADCLVSLQECSYVPALRPLLVKFIEVNVPGGVSNCSDASTVTPERCQAGIENCHNILNGILRNAFSKQQKCDTAVWFTYCLYSVEQCGLKEAARPMILKATESSLSVSNCSHYGKPQVTSTTTRPSRTTPITSRTRRTTQAQETTTPTQEKESTVDVRTCGEKTNLCYYQLNDIDPVTSNKAEKCERVFSVADCLVSLQECSYVPALRPLLVKFIEVNVPGGVSNCSDASTVTPERCQAGIENCHNILNGILRNAFSKQQKCDTAVWFTNCLYSVEQCGLEEAARPMILKATESSLSVSNCSHYGKAQVTSTTTRPSRTTPIPSGTRRTTQAQQTSAPNQGNQTTFDVRTCGEKTNLCYDLLNDTDPVTANKAEKCERVFSVADCLVSLPECRYFPALRPLLIKYIEIGVPGGVSNCSNQTTATADLCQAGIENCHKNLNAILRNGFSEQQKCDAALWFTNCLYSVEECGIEEAARSMILKAAESSVSVSNCLHSESTKMTTPIASGSRKTSTSTPTSKTTIATQQPVTLQPVTSSNSCFREEFKCGNGRCVSLKQICNGQNDCGDNSDEALCDTEQLEIVYELENLFKKRGCDDVLTNCLADKFEPVLQNPSRRPDEDSICTAFGSAFRCAVYEKCSLDPQDRETVASLMEKSFQLSTKGNSCTIPRSRFGDGPNCVDSCKGKKSGDYQSCKGCNVYLTCVGLIMYDSRPCPGNLVWDDELKKCTYVSTTCYKKLLP